MMRGLHRQEDNLKTCCSSASGEIILMTWSRRAFDPAAVSREALCNYLLEPQYGGNRCFQLWAKSSFDKLLSLGFDLEAEDFIIIDETTEPALRNLCGELDLHG